MTLNAGFYVIRKKDLQKFLKTVSYARKSIVKFLKEGSTEEVVVIRGFDAVLKNFTNVQNFLRKRLSKLSEELSMGYHVVIFVMENIEGIDDPRVGGIPLKPLFGFRLEAVIDESLIYWYISIPF